MREIAPLRVNLRRLLRPQGILLRSARRLDDEFSHTTGIWLRITAWGREGISTSSAVIPALRSGPSAKPIISLSSPQLYISLVIIYLDREIYIPRALSSGHLKKHLLAVARRRVCVGYVMLSQSHVPVGFLPFVKLAQHNTCSQDYFIGNRAWLAKQHGITLSLTSNRVPGVYFLLDSLAGVPVETQLENAKGGPVGVNVMFFMPFGRRRERVIGAHSLEPIWPSTETEERITALPHNALQSRPGSSRTIDLYQVRKVINLPACCQASGSVQARGR